MFGLMTITTMEIFLASEQLGRSFPIFQDRNDIRWGQAWQERIDQSLLEVTFLMPVLTPSFFNSPPCINEFKAFHLKEKQFGFNQLILPVYYVDCDQLAPGYAEKKDPVADALRSRQWTDWRDKRFKNSSDPEVAAALAFMAKEIKAAMGKLEEELDAEMLSQPTNPSHKIRSIKVPNAYKLDSRQLSEISSVKIPEVRMEDGASHVSGAQPPEEMYCAYTKKFDEIVRAKELISSDELFILNRVLSKKTSKITNALLPKHSAPFEHSSAVILLLDNSGSMRGEPIKNLAAHTLILTEWLEARGAAVEVLGYTTRAWKGGMSLQLWRSDGKPSNPGRLNDLRHIIYKDFEEPAREAVPNFGVMLREGILKENIDGEALLWAYSRIIARPEVRKLVVIFSDGAPVDDMTLSVNSGSFLERHFRSSVRYIESSNDVELLGVGFGHNISRYVSKAIDFPNPEKIDGSLFKAVDESLTRKCLAV
jgi:cobaltochelatase CobT